MAPCIAETICVWMAVVIWVSICVSASCMKPWMAEEICAPSEAAIAPSTPFRSAISAMAAPVW